MPSIEVITALREPGVVLMATATSLHEARAIQAAGIDAIVARGIQAGGHRGVLDPAAPDEALGTFALTLLLVLKTGLPVIAAGALWTVPGSPRPFIWALLWRSSALPSLPAPRAPPMTAIVPR